VVIDYNTALGILNRETVFNVGERLLCYLRFNPAPIELLNKLLSLLGDPEYIEVGVLGKCSDITLLSGVSGERCITSYLLKMPSDRVLELHREFLDRYERSAEEAEPMRGGVVDLQIVLKVQWLFCGV